VTVNFMKSEVIVPRLGSSDESDEVEIVHWAKKVGDQIRKGEPLVEVETDKVTVEIEAPGSGTLKAIFIQEGERTRSGAVVGLIEGET